MNDETPTPFDTVGDAPVEARIVAWVLGEASAFEVAELDRLCEERPELLVFRRRMRALHGLLTEAEAAEVDHSWKLPPEKRKVLDEIFGEEKVTRLHPEKELRINHSARRTFLAIAACLLLTIIVVKLIGPISQMSPMRMEENATSAQSAANTDLALQELNKAVRDQEDKVEERRKVLSTIVRTKGIIYKGQDSFYGQSGVDEDQGARSALQSFNELEQEKMQTESQLNSLQKYDGDQLMTYAAGINQPDNVVKNLLPQYAEAKRDLEKLKINGLGEDHPQVAAQAEQLKGMKAQLDEGVANLKSTLQAQHEMADMRLRQVEVMKDDSREEAIKRGLDAQDYVAAKRDFENDQQLLQALKLKQIDLSIAKAIASKEDARPASLEANGSYRVASKMAESNRESAVKKAKERTLLAERQPKPASEPIVPQLPRLMSAPARPSEVDSLPPIVATGLGGKAEGRVGGEAVAFAGRTLDDGEKSTRDAELGQALGKSMSRTRSLGVEAPAPESKDGSAELDTDAFSAGDKESAPVARPPVLAARKAPAGVVDESQVATRSNASMTSTYPKVGDQVRRQLYMAEGNLHLGKNEDAKAAYEKVLELDPYNTAARRGMDRLEAAKNDHLRADNNNTRSELLSQVDSAWELSVPVDEEAQKWQFPMEFEPPAEEAKALVDLINEVPAAETPYSTFSLNISDASFQLAKAALARGERPDPAGIKPEQFYNAVDYGDPAPASNQPVAATIEQSVHPVIPGRNLVRIALRTGSVGRSAVQPLHLTLLVDQSGSMVREDRRAAMEHALQQLGVLLTKNDLVTVIGFSRTPHLLADAMTGDQATKLGDLVNQTASEGGTNLEEALKLGGQLATRHQLAGAQNRIVLFTDGAANLGDAKPARLAEQVKAFRQQGLAFDIAGIGADGLNDRLLSELARNGNGRYYVVGDEKNDSFARQLAGAFRPAAENVKVQVNFNPQRVGKYKLIGFEKDRLKTEDFRNDAVDAAELAAEEAGVAIYQIEPLADGSGEIGDVSVRFRDVSGNEMVERTWTIPYESQATAFDRATPSMQLAGLSLLAAEKLKGGPLADAIDFKQLADSTSLVKQFYGNSPRVADMLQVIDALK